MEHLMRIALATACALLLGGWGWAKLQLTPPTNVPATYAYKFEDQRPKKWLKSGIESAETTNCAYGALRYGDNDIDPHLPVYLHAYLAERFGDRLAGRTVALRGFSLHINKAIPMRSEGLGGRDGLGAHLINAIHRKKVGCSPEDTFGGWTVGEVESEMPIIVAVDVFIDGQRFKGRAIRPGETVDWKTGVEELMPKALAQLGDRIEAQLFAAPTPATTPEAAAAGASE